MEIYFNRAYMELIQKYFPEITSEQYQQFEQMYGLYQEWNTKINVISRKDTDNFYERHVLHSLGIAKVIQFLPDTKVLDVGTGGGFPGIPLAILFPEVQFHLVDSIAKKVKVVQEATAFLGLKNVSSEQVRAEKIRPKHQFDFIICRAVTDISAFYRWVKEATTKENRHESFANGIFVLKGGDLKAEFQKLNKYHRFFDLQNEFEEDFFETKKVVYIKI